MSQVRSSLEWLRNQWNNGGIGKKAAIVAGFLFLWPFLLIYGLIAVVFEIIASIDRSGRFSTKAHWSIAILIVVGGLMAVSAVSPDTEDAAAATVPSPAAVEATTPPATPEPIVEPTVQPTPEPTIEATPDATEEPVLGEGATAAIAFGEHVGVTAPEIGEALTRLAQNPIDEDAQADLLTLIQDEMVWLADNEPADCYLDTHSLYAHGLELFEGSVQALQDGDIDIAMTFMQDGTATMTQAADQVQAEILSCAAE